MKKLLALSFLLACRLALGIQATVQIDIGYFDGTHALNRNVWVDHLAVPTIGSAGVVIANRTVTNSDGTFGKVVLPVELGLYHVTVLAPPQRTDFQFLITTNDTGLIYVTNNLVASSTATFPAGAVAWAAAISDNRYSRSTGALDFTIFQRASQNLTNWGSISTSVLASANFAVKQGTNVLTTTNGVEVTVNGLENTNVVNALADARALVATNELYKALTNGGGLSTNLSYQQMTNFVKDATNTVSGAVVTRITAATNDLNTVLRALQAQATNDLYATTTNFVKDATNTVSTALATRITAATNDLNTTLRAFTVAATNDLNTTLRSFTVAATNDLSGVLRTRMDAGTNDLYNTLSTKIGNATNGLNTAVAATYVVRANAVQTNAINYGNPLQSRGSGVNSLQLGIFAVSSGDGSTAVGVSSISAGGNSTAIGNSADAVNPGSVALGYNSVASGTNSVAIGNAASTPYNTSVAIGNASQSTAANQVRLGTSSEYVSIPGGLNIEGIGTGVVYLATGSRITNGTGVGNFSGDGIASTNFRGQGVNITNLQGSNLGSQVYPTNYPIIAGTGIAITTNTASYTLSQLESNAVVAASTGIIVATNAGANGITAYTISQLESNAVVIAGPGASVATNALANGITTYTVTENGAASAWNTNGNLGTTASSFLGTTDSNPIRFKVNQSQVGIFQDKSPVGQPDILLGYNPSIAGSLGIAATISGGVSNASGTGLYNTIAGGFHNGIFEDGAWNVISGGYSNTVGTWDGGTMHAATISGGWLNTNGQPYSVIVGGFKNSTIGNHQDSVIVGGGFNVASNEYSVIVGGNFNLNESYAGTIIGNFITNITDSSTEIGNMDTTKTTFRTNQVQVRTALMMKGVIYATNSMVIKSNTLASIPALSPGDIYFWSSNGVAYKISAAPNGTFTTNAF